MNKFDLIRQQKINSHIQEKRTKREEEIQKIREINILLVTDPLYAIPILNLEKDIKKYIPTLMELLKSDNDVLVHYVSELLVKHGIDLNL